MKFSINKMILWFADGKTRELQFEKNKINVITGNSKTGKTAILEIIDYCLCGSESNISEKYIGETVKWYGLNFNINNKTYTIARGEYRNKKPSKEYYFSEEGGIPKIPRCTISENNLKGILENEFSVTKKVTFSYGGKTIKGNSKISYRYFWMFNTLSGDVITNSKTFFDKQHLDRYREALPRIFDLAVGIITLDSIALRDEIDKLQKHLDSLERKKKKYLEKQEERKYRMMEVIKEAKEFNIIDVGNKDYEIDIKNLRSAIIDDNLASVLCNISDQEKLEKKRQKLLLDLNKLDRFLMQYDNYKKSIKEQEDSLKPILYFKELAGDITNEEYRVFLDMLEKEYTRIKASIRGKMPFEIDIVNKKEQITSEIKEIEDKIKITPKERTIPISDRERYIKIGELKSRYLSLLNQDNDFDNIDSDIEKVQKQLEEYGKNQISYEERKINTIDAINDYVQTYIDHAKQAFDDYGEYLASFDYKRKILNLRKNKSSSVENITSSSDHLFLHLCLFLGMHEKMLNDKNPHIASFLILDQPSRPYFNNRDFNYAQSKNFVSKKEDWSKVKQIFKLLDCFMNTLTNPVDEENRKEFQLIVLEHVSTDAWDGCKHVVLVDKIFDGEKNALIPLEKVHKK